MFSFDEGSIVFQEELKDCGLTEDVLQKVYQQMCAGSKDLCWRVEQPVSVGFYQELYKYLRKWPLSKSSTKTAIGRFFLSIDPNFVH